MKTITKDELASKQGSPWVTIVNVLSPETYEKIHIKDSISVPLEELKKGKWADLDSSKEIVVHCSSYTCDASKEAAEFLEGKGFDVYAYEGGTREWAESGLPTEGTVPPNQYLLEKYGQTPMGSAT